MKRFVVLMILIITAVTLCACGSDKSSSEKKKEAKHHYTKQQTDMSNHLNDGIIRSEDGWVYSIRWDEDSPLFMKMRTDGSDEKVIRYKGVPYFITVKGEYIYTAITNSNDDKSNIFRYRLSGDKEKRVVKNATDMQIVGDELYYSKCKKRRKPIKYCKSDLTGKNEKVVLDKEIYYPFIVDNLLYYQDDKDNETIHVYDLDKKKDSQITSEITYSYVLNDDYMYCILNDKSVGDKDFSGRLVKIDLKTKKVQELYNGVYTHGITLKDDTIYYINANDDFRIYKMDKNGENIGIVTQDNYCTPPYIYDDKMYYVDYSKNFKFCDNLIMCDLDGSHKKKLTKRY